MKKFIKTADSWQIFSAFIAVMIIYSLIPDDGDSWKVASSLLLALTICGWFLVLGLCLNENLPAVEKKPGLFFVMCCSYNIFLVSVSPLIGDLGLDEEVVVYASLVVILFVASFFYMIYFTSILYTVAQERLTAKEQLRAEVIFISFVGFILGIFVLQPRIKRIFNSSSSI